MMNATQATSTWLLNNIQTGSYQKFAFPTGSGGRVIVKEALRQWREKHPDDTILILTSTAVMAAQWKMDDVVVKPVYMVDIDLRKDGTIAGLRPSQIGMVVVDDTFPAQRKRLDDVLAHLAGATILEMAGGMKVPAPMQT